MMHVYADLHPEPAWPSVGEAANRAGRIIPARTWAGLGCVAVARSTGLTTFNDIGFGQLERGKVANSH